MDFQKIAPIDLPQTHLDIALKRGAKHAAEVRQKLRRLEGVDRLRKFEQERLNAIGNSLHLSLSRIPATFPSIDDLPEFYQKLIEATLDNEELRQHLITVSAAANTAQKLASELCRAYGAAMTESEVLQKNAKPSVDFLVLQTS